MNDPNNYWASSPVPAPVAYPKTLFHATEDPKRVNSEAEQTALGEGWSETYIHRDFPKMKFRLGADGKVEQKVVADPEEESKLGMGWSDTQPEPQPEPPAPL